MAAITWTDVTDVASELTTISSAAQTTILAYVNATFDVDVFDGEAGPATKLARVYLAAHMGTITKPGTGAGGAAGPITSQSAGGLSRSYAVAAGSTSSSGLQRTGYGQLLDMLIQTSAARAPFTVP